MIVSHSALFKQHPEKQREKEMKFSESTSFTSLWCRNPPGLHPAFGPQRFDLGLHEDLEVILGWEWTLTLQLVTAQLHPHQITQQCPAQTHTHTHQAFTEGLSHDHHIRDLWELTSDFHLSLSSHTNFFLGPITLRPGFSSSSSSEPFLSPSSVCCLHKHTTVNTQRSLQLFIRTSFSSSSGLQDDFMGIYVIWHPQIKVSQKYHKMIPHDTYKCSGTVRIGNVMYY